MKAAHFNKGKAMALSKVKQGDTVKVHYKASSKEGIIFDSATLPEPLLVTIGHNQVIPAFEKALVGMKIGEKKTITLLSNDAFGPYLKELITIMPRKELPLDLKLSLGQHIQIQQPDGTAFIAKVIDLSEDFVTFDANHPLAGKDITFDIHLIEIV
jgi:peptidylprolyl isomerase